MKTCFLRWRQGKHGGNLQTAAGVDDVVHELHRMLPFLFGLAIEEAGQPGQALGIEVRGDRDVLERRSHLVTDLCVEGLVQLLAGLHFRSPPIVSADRHGDQPRP